MAGDDLWCTRCFAETTGDASGVGAVIERAGGARREDEPAPALVTAEMVSILGGGGDGVRARSGLECERAERGPFPLLDFGLNLPAVGFKIGFELLGPVSAILVIEMAESVDGCIPRSWSVFPLTAVAAVRWWTGS